MDSWIVNSLRSQTVFAPYSGNGYLAGEGLAVTSIDGVAASCYIALLSYKSKQLLYRVKSASDGTWRINNLNPDAQFTVIAFDPHLNFNAAIQDGVFPHVEP